MHKKLPHLVITEFVTFAIVQNTHKYLLNEGVVSSIVENVSVGRPK